MVRSFDRVHLIEAKSKDSASASIGDLNGDGFPDIVLARGRHIPLYNHILLNDGKGNFTVSNLSDTPDQTYAVALGDMDRDGRLDVVVSNDSPDNKTVYRNQGKGRFRAMATFGDPAWQARYVALADFNKDGFPDIAVANRGMKSSVCWNNRKGAFPNCTRLASTKSPTIIVAADFDGDGAIDLFVPHRDGTQSVVLWNDGKGGFTTSTKPFGTSAAYVRAAAAGDLNGDGQVDIVVGSEEGGVKYYLNTGKRTFSKPTSLCSTKSAVYSIVIADLNRDRMMDVIVGYKLARGSIFYKTSSSNAYLEVPWNNGKGTVYGIAVADLDGDGWKDIVTARSDAPNAVWFSTPAKLA